MILVLVDIICDTCELHVWNDGSHAINCEEKDTKVVFRPGCDVGYTKCVEKVSLFRAPACPEQFSKWARAIPRADKPLQENCVGICMKILSV